MLESVPAAQETQTSPGGPQAPTGQAPTGRTSAWPYLSLVFQSEEAARGFLRALSSLLYSASTRITATPPSGAERSDLTAEELSLRLARGALSRLRFSLPPSNGSGTGGSGTGGSNTGGSNTGGSNTAQPLELDAILITWAELTRVSPTLEAEALPADATGVAGVGICVPFVSTPARSSLWLQADVEAQAPIPALMLPITPSGLPIDAAHALVGLAIRAGGFRGGLLKHGATSTDPPITWWRKPLAEQALPLRSMLRDAVWTVAPDSVDSSSDAPTAAWVSGLPSPPAPAQPPDTWWENFELLTRSPEASLPALHAHLDRLTIPFPWILVDARQAPAGTFVVPPEASAVARLLPEPDLVRVAIDLEQPATLIAAALLHLCAHLALGHVRPGDSWGHGDLEARFAYAPEFRDDVQFGVQVPRVGDYLKEQEKRLVIQQEAVRAAIQSGQPVATDTARIAGELLDRIVVQRSRALCKQIEREYGSTAGNDTLNWPHFEGK